MRGLSNDLYVIPTAELLFKPIGTPKFLNLGSASAISIAVSVEESKVYANNVGTRTVAKTFVTQKEASVKLTLQQMSGFARAAAVMGDIDVMSQAAGTAATATVEMEEGGIYKLPHLKISDVVIAGATAGVDYEVDEDAGFIESVTLTGSKTVTYDHAAISSGHRSGIASNSGIRGTLVIRGVNDEGVRSMITLHDWEARPDGERSLLSESEAATIGITGTAYPVVGKPQGYSIGEEVTL